MGWVLGEKRDSLNCVIFDVANLADTTLKAMGLRECRTIF